MEKVSPKRWIASLFTFALAFIGGIEVASWRTDVLEYQAAAGFAGLACAFWWRSWEWQAGFEVGKWSSRG